MRYCGSSSRNMAPSNWRRRWGCRSRFSTSGVSRTAAKPRAAGIHWSVWRRSRRQRATGCCWIISANRQAGGSCGRMNCRSWCARSGKSSSRSWIKCCNRLTEGSRRMFANARRKVPAAHREVPAVQTGCPAGVAGFWRRNGTNIYLVTFSPGLAASPDWLPPLAGTVRFVQSGVTVPGANAFPRRFTVTALDVECGETSPL